MAIHHGKNGKIRLGANAVAAVTNWSINETVPDADTTVMRDTASTHLVGIPSWTGSFDVKFDPADTNGQVALVIGASLSFGIYSDGDASGKRYFTGTASVVGITRTGTLTEAVTASFSIKGNGALTSTTVP